MPYHDFPPKTVPRDASLAKRKFFKLKTQYGASEKHQFFEMDQQ
jgi:hypothetical protein